MGLNEADEGASSPGGGPIFRGSASSNTNGALDRSGGVLSVNVRRG
jgi:hypothetical protein